MKELEQGVELPSKLNLYLHDVRVECQIPQGPQDGVPPAEQDRCSVNSHFSQGPMLAEALRVHSQRWQRIHHKRRCKVLHVCRAQDLGALDEVTHSSCLLRAHI